MVATSLIQPVIMAGGSGTRLWPLSRAGYPKQFLVIGGQHSLLQQAALRLKSLATEDLSVAAPFVVGNEDHRFMVLDQLREAKAMPSAVLLEPVGRNTAPAVTLAALQAIELGQDPVLVVSPSDQTVASEATFTRALQAAARRAASGEIVILGIKPDRAETGYGYVRAEGSAVAQFVEKPDAATAERYVKAGNYFWNAGIFVLKASVWLRALEKFRPDISTAMQRAWDARKTDDIFVRPGKPEFSAVPSESVDYAVMERCAGSEFPLGMEVLDAGWNDLGAWEAVWQAASKDEAGNGQIGDCLLEDCSNTYVHAGERLVAAVGLNDVVIVETPDAILVADRNRSQDVKRIVNRLGGEQRSEHALHRKVHRPWGWYDSIDMGERFQVKRILVKPGASLSLQKHHHRAEHWIVVSGTAEVTNGDQTLLLTENQSTYIPLGQVHRLANPGKVPLEIIEVQSGSYLGEDDIVRFEDTYGRA
jgi:mannose-1-phosphate guanylyltransferase / mannose-6-phosphate isomerase